MRIIAGKYRSRKINSQLPAKASPRPAPDKQDEHKSLRPTTDRARESLFNILNNIIDFEGLKCLDLFAGTGSVGFELISRGANSVSFVESSQMQVKLIEKTAEELGCQSQIEVHMQNAAAYLSEHKGGYFDLIFADPPYNAVENEKWPGALARIGFNIFVFEHGLYKPDYVFSGYEIMERKTGITNFKIYISEN